MKIRISQRELHATRPYQARSTPEPHQPKPPALRPEALPIAQPFSPTLAEAQSLALALVEKLNLPQVAATPAAISGKEASILEKAMAFYFAATHLNEAYDQSSALAKDLHHLAALSEFVNKPGSRTILAISLSIESSALLETIQFMIAEIKTNLGEAKAWEKKSAASETNLPELPPLQALKEIAPWVNVIPRWKKLGNFVCEVGVVFGAVGSAILAIFFRGLQISECGPYLAFTLPTTILSMFAHVALENIFKLTKPHFSIAEEIYYFLKKTIEDLNLLHEAIKHKNLNGTKKGKQQQPGKPHRSTKTVVTFVSAQVKWLAETPTEKITPADEARISKEAKDISNLIRETRDRIFG